MPKWFDITRSDKFQALPQEEQVAVKQRFFERFMLPELDKDEDLKAPDVKQAIFQKFMSSPDDTGQGYVTSMLGAAGRGFGEMVPGAIEGVGALTGSEGIREAGQDLRSGLESIAPVNPIYAESIPVKLAGVGGQVGSVLATAGAGGAVGKALGGVGAVGKGAQTAALGSAFLQGAAEGRREAEQYGMEGPKAYMRTLAGGAIEAGTEFLPFGMVSETALAKRMFASAPKTSSFLGAVGSEAGEESLGQVGSNIATKTLAPIGVETPGITEGVLEAGTFGAFGGGLIGGVNAFIPTAPQDQTPAQKQWQAEINATPVQEAPSVTPEESAKNAEQGGAPVVTPGGQVTWLPAMSEALRPIQQAAVKQPSDVEQRLEETMRNPALEIAKEIGEAATENLANTGNNQSAAANDYFNATLDEIEAQAAQPPVQPSETQQAPSPATEMTEKSSQTITGSNVQTGTEMPVPDESTVTSLGEAPLVTPEEESLAAQRRADLLSAAADAAKGKTKAQVSPVVTAMVTPQQMAQGELPIERGRHRFSKASLGKLPKLVADFLSSKKTNLDKAFNFAPATSVDLAEDGYYTLINPATGESRTLSVAGEFSGLQGGANRVEPTSNVPIPPGAYVGYRTPQGAFGVLFNPQQPTPQENAPSEIPLEESLPEEPQGRVESREVEEAGVGDQLRGAEESEEVNQLSKELDDIPLRGKALNSESNAANITDLGNRIAASGNSDLIERALVGFEDAIGFIKGRTEGSKKVKAALAEQVEKLRQAQITPQGKPTPATEGKVTPGGVATERDIETGAPRLDPKNDYFASNLASRAWRIAAGMQWDDNASDWIHPDYPGRSRSVVEAEITESNPPQKTDVQRVFNELAKSYGREDLIKGEKTEKQDAQDFIQVGRFVKVGHRVPVYEKGEVVGGKTNKVVGKITRIIPDGKVEVRLNQGGFKVLPPSEIEDAPTHVGNKPLSPQTTAAETQISGVATERETDEERFQRIKNISPSQRTDEDIAFANAFSKRQKELKPQAGETTRKAFISSHTASIGGRLRKALDQGMNFRGLKGTVGSWVETLYNEGWRMALDARGNRQFTNGTEALGSSGLGKVGMNYADFLSSQPQTTAAETQTPESLRVDSGAAGVVQSEPVEGSIPTDEKESAKTAIESTEKSLEQPGYGTKLNAIRKSIRDLGPDSQKAQTQALNDLMAMPLADLQAAFEVVTGIPTKLANKRQLANNVLNEILAESRNEKLPEADETFRKAEIEAEEEIQRQNAQSLARIFNDKLRTNPVKGLVSSGDVERAIGQLQNSGEVPGAIFTWRGTAKELQRLAKTPAFKRAFPGAAQAAEQGNVEGIYENGMAFVITDQVVVTDLDRARAAAEGTTPEVAAAKRVIAHENYHKGVALLSPKDQAQLVSLLRKLFPAAELDDLAKSYKQYADWRTNRASEYALLEEKMQKAIEEMKEVPRDGLLRELVDFLKAIWRKLTGQPKGEPRLRDLKDVVRLLRSTLKDSHKAQANRTANGGRVMMSLPAFRNFVPAVQINGRIETGMSHYEAWLKHAIRQIPNYKKDGLSDAEVKNLADKWLVDHPEVMANSMTREGFMTDEGYLNRQDSLKKFLALGGKQRLDPGEVRDWLDSADVDSARMSLGANMIDAEYLEAVANGDMEKAQRMVDEAAKKAGGIFVYQGVGNGGEIVGNVFNKDTIGKSGSDLSKQGYFFTKSKEVADNYARVSKGKTKEFFIFPKNTLEADQFFNFDPSRHFNTGGDSVLFKNVTDVWGPSDNYMVGVGHENQIKSADPITYDDAGNVIPLSQRFQPSSPDIRFSLATPVEYSSTNNEIASSAQQTARNIEYTPRQLEVHFAVRKAYDAMPKDNGIAVPLFELFDKTKEFVPDLNAQEFSQIVQGLYDDNAALLHKGEGEFNILNRDSEPASSVVILPGKGMASLGTALSPQDYARHAELEAKHNAGTITDAERREAEALVEKAAKEAGYNVGPVWHGTVSDKPFNVFKQSTWQGKALFFATRPGAIEILSGRKNTKTLGPFYLKLDRRKLLDEDEWRRFISGPSRFDPKGKEGFIRGPEIAVFDPSQIKSADPFTGVPLEQRFDVTAPDIRFSYGTPDLSAAQNFHNEVKVIAQGLPVGGEYQGRKMKGIEKVEDHAKFNATAMGDAAERLLTALSKDHSLEEIFELVQQPDFQRELGLFDPEMNKSNAAKLTYLKVLAQLKQRAWHAENKARTDGQRIKANVLYRQVSQYYANLTTGGGQYLQSIQDIHDDPRSRFAFEIERYEKEMNDANAEAVENQAGPEGMNPVKSDINTMINESGENAATDVLEDVEEDQDAILLSEGESSLDAERSKIWGRMKDVLRKLALIARAKMMRAANAAKASISKAESDAILQMSDAELASLEKKLLDEFDTLSKAFLGEEKSPERENRENMVKKIKGRVNNGKDVDPKPSSDPTMRDVLREINKARREIKGANEKPIQWAEILRQSPKSTEKAIGTEEYRKRIFDAMMASDAFKGMSDEQKGKLADLFSEAWEKKRTAILDKMLDTYSENLDHQKERRKLAKALKDSRNQLLELVNLGVYNNDELVRAIGERFGLKTGFTAEEKAKLNDLADKLQDDTLNQAKKNKLGREYLSLLQSASGVPASELLSNFWVSSVLTGGNTIVSIGLSFANGFYVIMGNHIARAWTELARGNYQVAADIMVDTFKSMAKWLKAYAPSAERAWNYLWSGDVSLLESAANDPFNNVRSLADIERYQMTAEKLANDPQKVKRYIGRYLRFVGRLLTALDAFNVMTTKAGSLAIAMRQTGLTSEQIKEIDAKNDMEVFKKRIIETDPFFKGQKPTDSFGRAYLNSLAEAEMYASLAKMGVQIENADYMAAESAFTMNPTGVGGIFYNFVKGIDAKATNFTKDFVKRAEGHWAKEKNWDTGWEMFLAHLAQFLSYQVVNALGLRFARFAGNKFNQGLSFIPGVGLLRRRELSNENLKGREQAFIDSIRRNQIAGLLLGVAGVTLLRSIVDEPDDEKRGWAINGGFNNLTPDQKRQKLARGEKEYTIRIGDLVWNYQNWPISQPLAAVGAMSDMIRFSPDKWKEKGLGDKLMSGALSGLKATLEIPALTQVGELLGTGVSSKDPTEQTQNRLVRALAGWSGGFMPRFLKDIDYMAEPTMRKYETFWQRASSHIPVYRRYTGKDFYDILGNPVEKNAIPGSREFAKLDERPEYQILGALNSRGIWLTPANAEYRMIGKGRNRRRLTQEEADKYSLESGKEYRKMLIRYGARALRMPPEKAKNYISDLADKARDRALGKISNF